MYICIYIYIYCFVRMLQSRTEYDIRVSPCNFTVGQRRWRTAVSHLPIWRPPKQANKARPGLVFYNHYTLTQLYTQIDMGRGNSVPENCDLQSLNFVTRTLCIFGGRWRTRFQNNAWGGGLCLWGGGLAGRWGTLYLTKKPSSQMETTFVCITFIFAFLKRCFVWK